MIKKFVIFLKYLGIFSGVLLGVVACEKEFKNVGVNIVDNDIFSSEKHLSEVIAYSKDVTNNKTNNLDYYLLGISNDGDFGTFKASVASQLSLPSTNPDFGENAVIEAVVLDIPYEATLIGTQEVEDPSNPPSMITVNEFQLDSVWTSGTNSFNLNIYELYTYLNKLDPNDPTQNKEYFSDDSFDTTGASMYSGLITPSANDTMLVVDRYKHPNYPDTSNGVLYKQDTIKKIDVSPSLKIYFDNDFIKTRFQDPSMGSDFASVADFQHYFKGLYFEALEDGMNNTALMALKLSSATMTIYYSTSVQTDEGDDEDLDGNGINGESNVTIGTPLSFAFPLTGIKVNKFDRENLTAQVSNYIDINIPPDLVNGEDKIFIHGAAGSDGVIKLFGTDANTNDIPDELEVLRTKNWLINDAQLILNIDAANTTNRYPERLTLYNIDVDDSEMRLQTYDMMTQGIAAVDGSLQRDIDSIPYRYVFHITDYISELIKTENEVPIRDFGIKTYDPNDIPLSAVDTIIRPFSNNHKGVILTGNNPNTNANRVRLEIYYTEINE